jgi:protoheme ferro-lyase
MNEALPLVMAALQRCAAAAQPGRIGVLIVNLGTPDAPDAVSVRRYLKEFLSDPRVIENQGPVWRLVLNGVILRIRPRRKARDYASIWNTEKNESPLKTITRAQAEKLALGLAPLGNGIAVDWAMRYGNPSLASRLAQLVADGCERLLIIPLYPQYCAATTALLQRAVLYRGARAGDPCSAGQSRVRTASDPRLVPRRAEDLHRCRRSVLCPLRGDHAAAARAS